MTDDATRTCGRVPTGEPCRHVVPDGMEASPMPSAVPGTWLLRRSDGGPGTGVLKERRPYLSRREHALRVELQQRLARATPCVSDILRIARCEASLREYDVQELVSGDPLAYGNVRHAHRLGRALAEIHRASAPVVAARPLQFGHAEPRTRFEKARHHWQRLEKQVPERLGRVLDALWDALERAESRHVVSGSGELVLCHGDPDPSNGFLVDGTSLVLIDFDDMHVDAPASDLAWMLLTMGVMTESDGFRAGWPHALTEAAWLGYGERCADRAAVLADLPHYLVASVCCGLVDQFCDPVNGWRIGSAELGRQCAHALDLVRSASREAERLAALPWSADSSE